MIREGMKMPKAKADYPRSEKNTEMGLVVLGPIACVESVPPAPSR
jgi:hypothetical protein